MDTATGEHGDAREFWEQHYRGKTRVWSGRVNARLAELAPGRALDLGCGEGADVLWLAERGWQCWDSTSRTPRWSVPPPTPMRGACRGGPNSRATTFLTRSRTAPSTWSLPSSCTVRCDSTGLVWCAAQSTPWRSAGLLLIVDHAAAPPWAWKLDHHHEFPDPDTVLASLHLDAGSWERIRVGCAERPATGPDGQVATIIDNVMLLRRVR